MSAADITVSFEISPTTPLSILPLGIIARAASTADIEEWKAVAKEIFGYALPPRIVEQYFVKGQVFFFELPTRVVVGIGGWVRSGAQGCTLNYLGVRMLFRGKGYGDFIARYSVNSAFATGYRTIGVITSINRMPAVNLYFKTGFRCIAVQRKQGLTPVEIEALHKAGGD